MTKAEFRFGEGKISGVLGLVLALLSLGGVLCFRYPELTTTPELRAVYPVETLRAVLAFCLSLSAILGGLSVVLSAKPWLGVAGLGVALVATALGGATIPATPHVAPSPYVGLDWLVLDLLILALLFVPFERLFPRLPEQKVFRAGWKTDLVHFAVSHLGVAVTVVVTMTPARHAFGWAVSPTIQTAVAAQPAWLQFLEGLLAADLVQYSVHRAFHAVPFLWRFHAIHHSPREMDWLMGSRLHIVDILVTRSLAFVPLYVLGFPQPVLNACLVFLAFQAVFIHANTRLRFGPLRWVIGTPEYHHWHHAAEPEAIDKNFAVTWPFLDRIFGTQYLPDRWPRAYGVDGEAVPEGYWNQLWWPLRGYTRRPSRRNARR